MSEHCCKCWRCVDEHEINICAKCTLEELQLRVASKGNAFSLSEPCECEPFNNGTETSYCAYHYDLIMRDCEVKGGGNPMSN